MLLTGLGWAVSSPVESSPDEDFRLGSIWCPRPVGEYCQTSVVNGRPVARVPVAVSDDSMKCYNFQPDRSAGCALGYNDSEMAWTKRFDHSGAYPVGYYHFHHLFIGQDVQTSVLVMRGVNVLIAVGEGWHSGVIGIAASRLVERYYRPSLVITVKDGIGKGSCRSIKGFSMYEALTYCKDLLIRFGGHAMAAGFTV